MIDGTKAKSATERESKMYTFIEKIYSTQGVHMTENDGGDKMGERWNQVGNSEGAITFFRKIPKSACVRACWKA